MAKVTKSFAEPFTRTELDPVAVIFGAASQMNTPKISLFKEMLLSTHPAYQRHIDFWHMMGDIALDRLEGDKGKKKYIVQGLTEPNPFFEKRLEITEFLPETPGILDEFVGSVYQQPISRSFPKVRGDVLNEFIDAANEDEQPISAVMEEAARFVLAFGSVDLMLDRPAGQPSKKPNIVMYTPENRLDWQANDMGGFAWVKYLDAFQMKPAWISQPIHVQEIRIVTGPVKDQKGTISIFQILTTTVNKQKKELIRVFDSTTQQWLDLVDPDNPPAWTPIQHDFHRTPVETIYWKKTESGVGDPWAKQMVRADIKAFVGESDLSWDIFIHAHPVIKAWLHDDDEEDDDGNKISPLSQIELGTNWAVHLDPGNDQKKPEDIEYMNLDTSELSLQMESIEKTRTILRRLAGGGPDSDKSQTWGHPESGAALAIRMNKRAKHFGKLARVMENTEFMIFELVALEANPKLDVTKGEKPLRIGYPQRFDMRTVEDLHKHLAFAAEIGSQTLITDTSKLLAARIHGHGAVQDQMDKVENEIDKKEGRIRIMLADESGKMGMIDVDPTQPEKSELEEITFNEISLALERAARIGDKGTVDILREEMARRLGKPTPPPIDESLLPADLRKQQIETQAEAGKFRAAKVET